MKAFIGRVLERVDRERLQRTVLDPVLSSIIRSTWREVFSHRREKEEIEFITEGSMIMDLRDYFEYIR